MTKGGSAKKVNAKKVAKAVEDKTFGMKNKGGKKSQAIAKQVASTIAGNQRKSQAGNAKQAPSKKALKAERDEELARLGLLKTVPKKTAAPTASSSNENVVDFDNNNPDGRMLEDIIEDMRRKLPANRTPVTPETFAVWYAKKKKEKAEKSQKKQSKREKDIALGRVAMTGRELFERKRNVFIDDDRADEDHYDKDDTAAVFVASLEEQMRMDAEVNGVEFDEEKFKVERDKVLQRIKEDRDAKVAKSSSSSSAPNSSSAPPTSDASSANINVDALGTVPPIDESLFNEEDIPDDIDDEDDEEENVEEEE